VKQGCTDKHLGLSLVLSFSSVPFFLSFCLSHAVRLLDEAKDMAHSVACAR
jgi:hypothetical protein